MTTLTPDPAFAQENEQQRSPAKGATVAISVVTPTYKRPQLLKRCLTALLAQDLASCRYEIIVVDDAACAETARLVASFAAQAARGLAVRYLVGTGPHHGPAAARNLGWRAACGEIIAFTDDDCVPAPNWLRAGLVAFEQAADEGELISGVSGKLVMPTSGIPTDYEHNAAQLAHSEFVTANCFYRADALAAVGGFDERFTAAWREDSDLRFRLLDMGARLVRSESAVVIHPIRPARWGVSLSQQCKSMYNALLYKKHPARYRKYVQPAPPWRYYATLGALLAAIVGALTGRRRVAALGGALWLWLTGAFCLRRLRGTRHTPAHITEMALTSALIPPLAIYWRLRGALKFRVWFL